MGGRYKFVFWGALFVAVVATFGAYRYLVAHSAPPKPATRAVVVASRDIPEGAAIDRTFLTLASWSPESIPPGAFASVDSVVGRVTRVNVFNGEPIVPGRLAPAARDRDSSSRFRPDSAPWQCASTTWRESAASSSQTAGSTCWSRSWTRRPAPRSPSCSWRTCASFPSARRSSATQAGKPNTATTVTLGVTPEEAERLAIAMNTGSIQLVLRGYGDPSNVAHRRRQLTRRAFAAESRTNSGR